MAAGTAYAKRFAGGFVDLPTKTTPIDQAFLNAVEVALLQLIGAAPTVDGQVAQWDNVNTRYGPALLLNKNIDPAAGIVKSKLDLSGANGIVNADVATAAAIARSKLNFGAGLVDADIAAAAAIVASKLAGYPTDIASVLRGDGSWAKGFSQIGDANLGANAIIQFTSIPQTFKHLLLVGMVRGAGASTVTDLDWQVNGSSAASYFSQNIGGTNAAAAAGLTSSATFGQTASNAMYADSATAGLFSPLVMFMPNYTEAKFPTSLSLTGNFGAPVASFTLMLFAAAAAAVTQIVLSGGALNQLKSGSHVTLYGLG